MLNKSVTSECGTHYHLTKIWTDQGREFEGELLEFCEDVGFHQYHIFNENKAIYAKCSNRSLKAQVVRYLRENWM